MESGPTNSTSHPEPEPLPYLGPRATYYWYGYRKPPEQYQNTSITEQQIGNVALNAVSDS